MKHQLERIMPIDIEFRNKETGCGTHAVFEFTYEDIEKLNNILSISGIDVEVKIRG